MNELLAEARVLPLHAQVSAHDRGTTDLPEWVTGSEATVHSERAVVVATRPDTAGDVLVRVLLGDDAEAGTRVLDGRIAISTGLEVGSVVASDLVTVPVAPGEHRLAVFVHPAESPSVVSFVLGRQPWT